MDPATSEIWEGGGRRFHVEKVVGNGAFGIVWRAVEEGGDGSLYAIKKVSHTTQKLERDEANPPDP